MRKKQEPVVAMQEEMEKAAEEMVAALTYVDAQLLTLKEERKAAIDTCVAAGVPRPVVTELLRRMGMDQEAKNVIDVYVPVLESYLENSIN